MSTDSLVVIDEPRAVADVFSDLTSIRVRQRRKWLEAILSLEFKNRYDMFSGAGLHVLDVCEEGDGVLSVLKRILMGPWRPFEASIVDHHGNYVLTLHRRFRFFFHRLEVEDGRGRPLGAIVKRWSWVRRIYAIEGPTGRERLRLFGPIFKPWTFEIQQNGRQVGLLQKKWSGLVNEMFTDADNFALEMTEVKDPTDRALVTAATVLVDVVHFERSK